MNSDWTGELAALATALCFAFGSTLFTLAGREIGAQLVNRTRLFVAVVLVIILHWLTLGSFLPLGVASDAVFWLALSGLLGLAAGDAFLMQAFVLVGPRLSMLMMATSPAFSVIMARVLLDESLKESQIAGIVITLCGLALVVTDTRGQSGVLSSEPDNRRLYIIGLLCGLGGSMGQAGGTVLSSMGLRGGIEPLSAVLIRLSTAMILVWLLTIVRGQFLPSFTRLRAHPRGLLRLFGGTVMGPVLGVWLSLIAVQRTAVGITSTLIALTPIFLIPISYFVFKETVTRRAILGTLIAFAGTVMLFT